jgi:hypothetical protein
MYQKDPAKRLSAISEIKNELATGRAKPELNSKLKFELRANFMH